MNRIAACFLVLLLCFSPAVPVLSQVAAASTPKVSELTVLPSNQQNGNACHIEASIAVAEGNVTDAQKAEHVTARLDVGSTDDIIFVTVESPWNKPFTLCYSASLGLCLRGQQDADWLQLVYNGIPLNADGLQSLVEPFLSAGGIVSPSSSNTEAHFPASAFEQPQIKLLREKLGQWKGGFISLSDIELNTAAADLRYLLGLYRLPAFLLQGDFQGEAPWLSFACEALTLDIQARNEINKVTFTGLCEILGAQSITLEGYADASGEVVLKGQSSEGTGTLRLFIWDNQNGASATFSLLDHTHQRLGLWTADLAMMENEIILSFDSETHVSWRRYSSRNTLAARKTENSFIMEWRAPDEYLSQLTLAIEETPIGTQFHFNGGQYYGQSVDLSLTLTQQSTSFQPPQETLSKAEIADVLQTYFSLSWE
ncbi:MAG: hypothetical protein PHI98_05945 [Eubacteriales bacterium]|nr:hypothetical protein [Eubacteriales bacterium]